MRQRRFPELSVTIVTLLLPIVTTSLSLPDYQLRMNRLNLTDSDIQLFGIPPLWGNGAGVGSYLGALISGFHGTGTESGALIGGGIGGLFDSFGAVRGVTMFSGSITGGLGSFLGRHLTTPFGPFLGLAGGALGGYQYYSREVEHQTVGTILGALGGLAVGGLLALLGPVFPTLSILISATTGALASFITNMSVAPLSLL